PQGGMSMLLQKLLPQDKRLNESLFEMAKIAHQACQSLKTLFLAKEPAAIERHSKEILDAKNACKATFESMTTALCQAFITPYDREDMQELATTLYKIPK